MTTWSGRVARSQSVPSTPVEFRLDSLFNAGNFAALVDSASKHLVEAEARGDSVLIGRFLTALGRGEVMMGRPSGIANLDRSITVSRTVRDTLNWMSALGYKSLVFSYQGRFDESVELNILRLELAQLSGDEASEAWARTMLGYIALLRGENESARREYTQAVDLFFGLDLQREALTPLVGLGRVYNSTRDIEKARECYLRVLETARAVGDRVNEGHAVNNLGTIEFDYGDMELAVRYYERALEIAKESGNLRGTITPATNIALANQYLGRFDEAARVYKRAIDDCKESGIDQFVPSLMTRMGEVRFLQRRLNASARWYRRVLNLPGALDKKSRDAAVYGLARSLAYLDSAQTALEFLETGVQSSPSPEFEIGISWIWSWCLSAVGRPREALAEALEAESPGQSNEQYTKVQSTALRLSECYRALGDHDRALEWFREGVRRHAGMHSTDDGYDWREAQGGVGVFLDVAPVLLEQPGKSRFEMESELFDVVQQFKLRTLIDRITEPRRMNAPSSQFAALQHVDLRTVQREVLKAGELFLDFSTGEQVGYLFAVTSDSCRLVTIPGRLTNMVEKVALYRQFLGQHPSQNAGALEPEDFDRYNRSMGAAIFGEVADLVESASVLLISPSKFYGGVPFGALSLPGSDGSYRQLIRSHEIQIVPSATVLAWHRSVEPGAPGAPGVPGASGEAAATGVLAIEPVKTGDLPGAHEEVESLRRRFAGVTVRHEPGRLAVSDVTASTGVIHIAAHTEVNDEKPWHSGILLGDAAGEFAADPYLRAGDIASARLPVRVAVLSGCETAMGRPSVGEGLAGLTSAFLSAGVRSVVATLWRVDDDVTADLIGRFYEGLADGQSVAAALRHAQLAIGALPESSHPFYWAGFVVVGDASVSVNLARKPSGLPTSLLLVLLGVVALGLALWILNHFNKLKKSSNVV